MRLMTVPITRWARRDELKGIEGHLRSKHVPFAYEEKQQNGEPVCRIVRKMAHADSQQLGIAS